MKNSFVFYTEWIEQIRLLEANGQQEDLDAFWSAIRAYVEDGSAEAVTALAQMTFVPIRNQIGRDTAKYEEISEKRRQARTKDNKTEQTITNDNKPEQKLTNSTEDDDVDVDDDVSPNGDKDISSAMTIIDGLPEPVPAETDPKKLTDRMLTEEFDVLWKDFPRKVGKHDASRHYKTARRQGTTFEEIQTGLWNYVNYTRGQPEKYIMNGSTWFCGHHWEDKRDRPVNDFERILAL